MPKPYWHIHHEVLLEFNTEPIENRIEYIKNYKDAEEIPIRLQLLKPVQGELPSAVIKAWDVFYKTGDAFDKAWDAYIKTQDAFDKPLNAYVKALDAYKKAVVAYKKALKDNELKIEKLHAKECPNCPWNGRTIFPDT